jgi:hypothetical protein
VHNHANWACISLPQGHSLLWHLQCFCSPSFALRQSGCHEAWQRCAEAPCHCASDFMASRQPTCFIEFDQKIQVRHVPPGLNKLLRRIASSTCHQTLADISCEARLIGQGMSTLPDLNRYARNKSTVSGSMTLAHHPHRNTSAGGLHRSCRVCWPWKRARDGGGTGVSLAGTQPEPASTTSQREFPTWQRPVERVLQAVHCTNDRNGGLGRASLGNLAVL